VATGTLDGRAHTRPRQVGAAVMESQRRKRTTCCSPIVGASDGGALSRVRGKVRCLSRVSRAIYRGIPRVLPWEPQAVYRGVEGRAAGGSIAGWNGLSRGGRQSRERSIAGWAADPRERMEGRTGFCLLFILFSSREDE
jgi:hypothetical protein